MNVGVVGGGFLGMALAQRLSARGHAVTVFERAEQLGGLTTWHDFGPFVWDRFYHVILPTDVHLIHFLHTIGLGDALRWQTTQTGCYVDRKMYSLSSTWDFLRFPPLSLWSKIRLAFTILYAARIRKWERLEAITVEAWLTKLSGRATYEKLWKPLLLAKLGRSYKRVSAVFIWTYIKRLYSARTSSARREQLGNVSGGYRTVFQRLQELIEDAGGEVRTGVGVERIERAEREGIQLKCSDGAYHFDKVIFTGPTSLLRRVAPRELFAPADLGREPEYLGVVCVVVISTRPVVPYYVVNIADDRIPFTGIIGMNSVIGTEETAGLYLTYLPKYIPSADPLLEAADDEIKLSFLRGLELMLPEFDPASITSVHVNRASRVQPLQVLGFSRLVPRRSTDHPDLYLLNTSQLVSKTLNNNEVLGLVNEFVEQLREDF